MAKKKNKSPDLYAWKMLGLILFGVGGVFILMYLIVQAFAQKTLLNGILAGIAAILFAPLVNTLTGFFDDSVEVTPYSAWQNYIGVLRSLALEIIFIAAMMPFIALGIASVIGGMLIFVIIVIYIVTFFQNVLHIDLGAAKDIGEDLWLVTKILLGILVYEGLFFAGYLFYQKREEKIWDWIRRVFS